MSLASVSKHWLRHLLFYGPRAFVGGYRIGIGTRVYRRAVIRTGRRGTIRMGRNCKILDYAMLRAENGSITLGDNVSVNPFTLLYGQGGLIVGNDVRIAAHCVVIPSNHLFEDRARPVRMQGLSKQGVVIEDDVWIGANVTVLDGVRIGRGCVIGAASVVTKSTEPFGVYVGNPARRIRERGRAAPPVPIARARSGS